MSSAHFTFNINSTVRYKPTARGLQIHRHRWDELNDITDGAFARISSYRPPQVDAEGYATEQLWVLMQTYGESMGNGVPLPMFTEIQIDSKDLTPVR